MLVLTALGSSTGVYYSLLHLLPPINSTAAVPRSSRLRAAAAVLSPASPMSDKEKKPKRPLKGRVFQCTGFPNCDKSFTRLEHLARHRRKHTGERPFTCPHCSKNFSRLDNLRQHKQTVHAYENYIKKRSAPPALSVPPVRPHDRADPLPATPVLFAPKVFSPPRLGLPHFAPAYYNGFADKTPARAPTALPLPLPLPALPQLVEPGDDAPQLRPPRKFNPGARPRPRPLALVHSFADDNAIGRAPRAPAVVVEPPLKTAPAVALFAACGASYGASSRLGFAPGAPALLFRVSTLMVSPLLPLFHQLFNQVPSASSVLFAPSSISGRSSALALALSVLLPSGGADAPEDSKAWLKNMLNDEPKKLAIGSLLSASTATVSDESAPPEPADPPRADDAQC